MTQEEEMEFIIRRSDLFSRYVRGLSPANKTIHEELKWLVKDIKNKDKIIKSIMG